MQPFVGIALKVCQELQIPPKQQGVIMRFSKIYTPEKIAKITNVAKTYPWSYKNPVAAFMKAVGEVNKEEKENG